MNKVLALRSIERQICSYEFEQVFDTATENEKAQVLKWIQEYNNHELKQWIKTKFMDEPNLRFLRSVAAKLRIPNYSRMDKATLQAVIDGRTNQTNIGPDFRSQTNAS